MLTGFTFWRTSNDRDHPDNRLRNDSSNADTSNSVGCSFLDLQQMIEFLGAMQSVADWLLVAACCLAVVWLVVDPLA